MNYTQYREHMYIGGDWVEPIRSASIKVENPFSEQVIGAIPEGCPEDVDNAVAAAADALPKWSATSVDERVRILGCVAEILGNTRESLALLITSELGMPLRQADRIQVGLPIATFESMAAVADATQWESQCGNSVVLREPVGVVAAITPWNFPLHQIAAKLAPALVAGCTVVLKPSELAPLNAFALMDVLNEAGLQPGVVNLVSGDGPVVGEALARHEAVDMVSFTGSVVAGRRVSVVAASTIKRVTLELGGKSPSIILDDSDLERAVRDTVGKCLLNSGQACNALTRLLVPASLASEAAQIAESAVARFMLGDPSHSDTRLGPLVSAPQRDRVRGCIDGAVAEGARLVTGGSEAPSEFPKGYFVKPTVFTDVTSTMKIAREEIFGPVLAIMPYYNEAEAVHIANDSIYGLAAGVWSGDPERANIVARQLKAGQVEINGGAYNPLAPFGGYKQSGNGREYGIFGLSEFLETKSIQT